jgi:hypothetical protein
MNPPAPGRRPPPPIDDLVRAYHEAGHVVADRRIGHRIIRVSLAIEGRFVKGELCGEGTRPARLLRKCIHEEIVEAGDEQELEEALVGFWAGPAAQWKYRPESVLLIHSEDELDKIRACVNILYPDDYRQRQSEIETIKRRAEALMDDPAIWGQVVVLAEPLARRKELSGERIDAILGAGGAGRPGGEGR